MTQTATLPFNPKLAQRPEQPHDSPAIETLLDAVFGGDRQQKTTYRLRQGVAPIAALSWVIAAADGVLAATIRYWPVLLPNGTTSLLLGPIAVAPAWQGQGLGSQLIRFTLHQAKTLSYTSMLLVGDAPYYHRFGFTRALTQGLTLPGWVDEARFLGLAWNKDVLPQQGMVRRWHGQA